ncbi:60S acidic ribosomal protein P2 [Rhincodon typus]|uniref:60S acidic ribosomal protein P2 n=1 Tax=Rhincodon typus TaxID=259920 RepID=UPI00202DDC0F|nr:60S acidic ribosomal protein P2 [Rhincodon typus]
MSFMSESQDEARSFSVRRPVREEIPEARPAPLPNRLTQPARMRYVAAYLLAVLGGNASPSSKDIKKILDSVGIEADDERLNKVISELKGKNVDDVITAGNAKLASVPAGGVATAAATVGAAPAAAAVAEEKKEEKKEESEESDDDMGFGLFD